VTVVWGGELCTEAVAGSGGGAGLVFEARRPRLGLGWKAWGGEKATLQ